MKSKSNEIYSNELCTCTNVDGNVHVTFNLKPKQQEIRLMGTEVEAEMLESVTRGMTHFLKDKSNNDIIPMNSRKVMLDLSNVSYLGLEMIDEVTHMAANALHDGFGFTITNVSLPIAMVLRGIGIDHYIDSAQSPFADVKMPTVKKAQRPESCKIAG